MKLNEIYQPGKARRYHFNAEIVQELSLFKSALGLKRMHANTVRQHGNYVGLFLCWLKEVGIPRREVSHQDIIEFMSHLQSLRYPSRFIGRTILAVRHYYQYLGVEKNPAAEIYVRGQVRKVPYQIVSMAELHRLYDQYQGLDPRSQRNRIMLSMMIHQALSVKDFNRLEIHHIKLKEGKIYIPRSSTLNARILPLQTTQLLALQEYLDVIRPQLFADIEKPRVRRKVNDIQWDKLHSQLFFSEVGNHNLKYVLFHLFRSLKKMNPRVTSTQVIRHSVITEWLKTQGLRQVQYQAGYRWVGTVERYKNYHLDELKEALRECHPLQ